jgi:hypothetical protein
LPVFVVAVFHFFNLLLLGTLHIFFLLVELFLVMRIDKGNNVHFVVVLLAKTGDYLLYLILIVRGAATQYLSL